MTARFKAIGINKFKVLFVSGTDEKIGNRDSAVYIFFPVTPGCKWYNRVLMLMTIIALTKTWDIYRLVCAINLLV